MARVGLKAYAGMFLLVVAFCGREVLAQTHHLVGGDGGWSSDLNVSSWLGGRVFRVGDKIWFMYPAAEDTIAELQSQEEFESCDIANPIRMYTDGLNDVTLDKEGTRYFTSGNVENCKNGMKLPVPIQPEAPLAPTPPESFPPFQPEPPLVPTPPEPFPIQPPSASPPPPPEFSPPVQPEPPTVPTPPEPFPIQPPSASPPPPPESSPPVQPEPPLVPPFPIKPPSASPPPPPESSPPVKPEPPLVPTPPEPFPIQPPSASPPPPPPPSAATTPSNVLSFVFCGSILSYFVL